MSHCRARPCRGLISSKRPQLEDATELARRIEEAARYVPLESLALSPQCGFASTAEGNLLAEDEQWPKLKLVVDTARKVWGGRGGVGVISGEAHAYCGAAASVNSLRSWDPRSLALCAQR